jgi:hypothetical protein
VIRVPGAALISRFDPLDLEGAVRRPDDARHLHRDRSFADMAERVGGTCIVAKEDSAPFRREVVGSQPVLAHQHRIERDRPDVDDEAA